MRIAHLFWSFTIGGAETMLVDVMNHQINKAKVELIIINNEYSEELLTNLDSRIDIILLKRKPKNYFPWHFIKLNFMLLNYRPDILHCHNYSLSKILLPRLLKRSVLTVHGYNRPLNKHNKYSEVVAISNAIYKDLFSKGVRNLSIINNGIRTHRIKTKEKFNDVIQIVCIGRLDHKIKGQDILLRAFSLAKSNNPKLKLHLVGNGKSKNYLKELANQLQISEDVIFHGAESRNNLYNSLNKYDVVVQPSLHEGFGLGAVEAMIAKVPLVISEAKGLIEVTEHGKHAFVFKHFDHLELSKLLLMIINKIKCEEMDHDFITKLSNARMHCISNYSVETTSDHYLALYEQIINL